MKEKDQESIEAPELENLREQEIENADGEPSEESNLDGDDDDDDSESIIEMLKEQKEELNRRLLRAHADLENLRKRSVRERQESIRYANKTIFQSMLEPLDNFDRALGAVTNPKDNFVIGVAMIHKQLMEVFSQNGVEPIKALQEPFDPHRHEALASEVSTEFEDHTVIEEFQKGYTFHGTLLRPSKVKVSIRPSEPQDEVDALSEAETSSEVPVPE